MKSNSSGKVLVVFLIIFAVLLVSLAAIAMFFFQKEMESRKLAESQLAEAKTSISKLDTELKDLKKQKFLLEEKNKEADDRINGLTDELELEKGLREETKKENQTLKDKVEKESKEKESIKQQLTEQLQSVQQKIAELESKLSEEQKHAQELEQVRSKLQEERDRAVKAASSVGEMIENKAPRPNTNVELEPIVVNPNEKNAASENGDKPKSASGQEGRILTVDAETEFVIINLGEKQGAKVGQILSVYRGKDYLGDIRVTRVQPEMAAADLIPPFTSQRVRKNDQVLIKD